jgi:hypothetical protein
MKIERPLRKRCQQNKDVRNQLERDTEERGTSNLLKLSSR